MTTSTYVLILPVLWTAQKRATEEVRVGGPPLRRIFSNRTSGQRGDPEYTEPRGAEIDYQVAAPTKLRTPTLQRATIAHKRLRMEGWRQRRLGPKAKNPSKEKQNRLDSDRPSTHGRTWTTRCAIGFTKSRNQWIAISFLTTTPPFITNLTCSSTAMSARGSPETAMISA
jgi:hypothetical protein